MALDLSMDIPANYRISVHGAVDEVWFEYHDQMTIKTEAKSMKRPLTTLTGRVGDQAALQGILSLLYDMRLPLISVEWLPGDQ